jgi:hypothetical protein
MKRGAELMRSLASYLIAITGGPRPDSDGTSGSRARAWRELCS